MHYNAKASAMNRPAFTTLRRLPQSGVIRVDSWYDDIKAGRLR